MTYARPIEELYNLETQEVRDEAARLATLMMSNQEKPILPQDEDDNEQEGGSGQGKPPPDIKC